MNIEELKAARNQLEKELEEVIRVKVAAFVGLTGIQIDRVMVDMVLLDIVGLKPSTVVNGVRVGLLL